jgi:putative flippase GtrA
MKSTFKQVRLLGESRVVTLKQLFLYALIGGIQLLADWTCFVLLTWLAVDVVSANILGRISGAILGFWLNGRYTFAQRCDGSSLDAGHAVRFVAGWALTAILSTLLVWLLNDMGGISVARLGKPIVDALLALIGFVLSKYWIFR